MHTREIDIIKSIHSEKLSERKWSIDRIIEVLIYYIIAFSLPSLVILKIYSDIKFDKLHWNSFILLALALIFSLLLLYAILNLYKLTRINGVSRGKNLDIIEKIVARRNWSLVWSNNQMALIQFQNHKTGFYRGQQMTILFDGKDILTNCMSFGLYSSPSPLHWFSNKTKIKVLEKEIKKEIKTFYNTVYN